METRNVKVSLETAKRWKELGGEFEKIALETFPELNVRNEWESKILGKDIDGFYISSLSYVVQFKNNCSKRDNATFKTEKQAKSALAYAQLTQLMALPEYNGDWVPDWSDDELKYTIGRYSNILEATYYSKQYYPISFKSSEIRDKFLENNLDLLKEYFEL